MKVTPWILITVIQTLLVSSAFCAQVTLPVGGDTSAPSGLAVTVSVDSWTKTRSRHMVRQRFDFSCGAASMATVLKNFYQVDNITSRKTLNSLLKISGHDEPIEKLKKSFAFSLGDLKTYAKKRGFRASGIALPIESLRKLKIPAILYIKTINYKHFVVFKGMTDRYVYLADPSFGNEKIRVSRFKEMFYTRSDKKYPGKGLIILPKTDNQKERVDLAFMQTPDRNQAVDVVFDREAIDNAISNRLIQNVMNSYPVIP